MSKVEFTGKVGADRMFFMDVPGEPKTTRGTWLAQVETNKGIMVFIKDNSTISGLAEANTERGAREKAEQYLERVKVREDLPNVQAYMVSEYDAVAARSFQEAIQWYKDKVVDDPESIYTEEESHVLDMNEKYWSDEGETHKQTVREMIDEGWEGKPFIVVTWNH
jgi:hypothetical protein